MKKIIANLAATAILISGLAGCGDSAMSLEYSLNSNGKTDASVCVSFPNGNLNVDGDAGYTFVFENTQKLYANDGVIDLDHALQSNDAKTLKVANYVDDWLENAVKVTSFEGHYDITVKGYVKETFTGLTFSIDRRFTNITDSVSLD